LALLWLVPLQMKAQVSSASYTMKDHWFVGAGIGTDLFLGDNITEYSALGKLKNSAGFSFGVQAGKFFSPLLGARVQLSYLTLKPRINGEEAENYNNYNPDKSDDGFYKISVFTGFVDGMLNLSHLLCPSRSSEKFNVVWLLGVGFNACGGLDSRFVKAPAGSNYTYYFREVEDLGEVGNTYQLNSEPSTMLALRTGLILNYMVTDKVGLNLEGTFAGTGDKMEGMVYDEPNDFYATLMVGCTYHF